MHILNNKKFEVLLFAFLILYPWYMVVSGIDMTDTGYWLTYYKNFFDTPSSAVRAFPTWLSLVIGAITNTILGGIGLLGFKIMKIITIYLSLFLVYRMLHSYTNRITILFSFSIAVVFVNIDHGSFVSHGTLTTLFYLLAAYYLYFGLVEEKRRYFMIAGIVLGLNIFIRFPNLLGIGLVIVVFYYDFIIGNTIKNSLKKVSYVLLGYVSSIITILIVMKLSGHLELYYEGLNAMMNSAKDSSSSHNLLSMLKNLMKDQVYAFSYGFIFIIEILFLAWLSRFWNNSKTISWSMVFIFSFLSILVIMKISNILHHPNYYFIHKGIIGIFYISLIFIVLKHAKTNPKFSTIALITFFIIELLPLGSDTHLRKYVEGMYLGLPVILIYIYTLPLIKLGPLSLNNGQIVFLKNYVSTTLVLFSFIVSTFYFAAYGDNSIKFKMISTVDHPLLKYNLTTEDRSRTLTEVTQNIQNYEKNYEYMFTYGRIPLIQYLSNTKPYIDNPNPLFDMPTTIKVKLEKASHGKSLPIVVRGKTNTGYKKWPTNAPRLSYRGKAAEMGLIIEDFLNVNGYKRVWENNDFEILIPSQKNK